MSGLDRRRFLQGSAAVAGGALLGAAGPFQGLVARAGGGGEQRGGDYGPLGPVPDRRDGVVRLELPAGFTYHSFHAAGTLLEAPASIPTPSRSDGMAAFRGRHGTTLVVRNHEINGAGGAFGDTSTAYDPSTGGGTTTFRVDRDGSILEAWVSLNGTQMNCAGGPTPWGSWVTCEETVNGPDVGPDFTRAPNTSLTQKHGYMFEVPADGESDRQPIRAAGRFAHEACVIDPKTGHAYLTEDNFAFPSGLYRYLPPDDGHRAKALADGGTLQMLRLVDVPNAELSGGQVVGMSYDVDWVDIPDPDPTFPAGTTNNAALVAVGDQGRAQGAARFSRLEGATFDAGIVWFISTQGGATAPGDVAPRGYGDGRGQVWAYHVSRRKLRLVYESPGAATLDLPDNVVASRSGALVLCEDNAEPNYLRGLTRDGVLFDFARNAIAGQAGDEFAGATFSPDYRTLFVNIQSGKSITFAITGPWHAGPFD